MRIRKVQPFTFILVLLANNASCNETSINNVEKTAQSIQVCNTEEDVYKHPNPSCTLEHLTDEVLFGICKKAGIHLKPNLTRKDLVEAARDCRWPGALLYRKYLDMMKETSFNVMSRYDRISFLLSINGVYDVEKIAALGQHLLDKLERGDKVLEDNELLQLLYDDYQNLTDKRSILDGIGIVLSNHGIQDRRERESLRRLLLEKLGEDESSPAIKKLLKKYKAEVLDLGYKMDDKEQSKDIGTYMLTSEEIAKLPEFSSRLDGIGDGQLKVFQWDGRAVISKWSAKKQRWYQPKELSNPDFDYFDIFDLVRKSIQYEHAIHIQISLNDHEGAINLFVGYNNGDDPLFATQRAFDEYRYSYLGKGEVERIADIVGEVVANGKSKNSSRLIPRPTAKDIAKLPNWKTKNKIVGLYEGEVKLFQIDGIVVASLWSNKSKTWNSQPERITESHYENGIGGFDVADLARKSIQYDHVISFSMGRGSYKKNVLAGYNYGDDPLLIARGIIDEYVLASDLVDPSSSSLLLEEVADTIRQFLPHTPGSDDQDYRPTQQDAKFVAIVCTFAMLIWYLGAKLERRRHKKKKVRKPPGISLLSCHQPKMEKTLYVKLSATKNLNGSQGRKLEGLIIKSGVEDIEMEKKTGQPKVMHKMIEASNGVVYVPVHIKGSEEAVQKAVVLIQHSIGKENLDEKIELPPTKPQPSFSPMPKSTTTSKVSTAPTRILKKIKSTVSSLSSTIWSSACISCQYLRSITINSYQNATSSVRSTFNGTLISFDDFMNRALALLTILYILYEYCKHDVIRPVLILVLIPLLTKKEAVKTAKSVIVVFGVLLGCIMLLKSRAVSTNRHEDCGLWASQGLCEKDSEYLEYMQMNCVSSCRVHNANFGTLNWAYTLPYLLFQSIIMILLTRFVTTSVASFWLGWNDACLFYEKWEQLLTLPFDFCQEGVHLLGARWSVWQANESIQEAVGADHVSTTMPPNSASVQELASSKVNGTEPLDKGDKRRNDTPETPVQRETNNDSGNNMATTASTAKSPPDTTVQEKEIPSEIGIDSSQGMTRDTITEVSISSLNDRSNISKTYSNFTLDEKDPLFIFLRSQASCIKGSVDEFYTWLVKSEDIDSMLALKEAMSDDDYLSDMKVGDGSSGIKGFKRKAFRRAISEYFNDKSTKLVESPLATNACEPPEELVCPISLVLMTNDPVVAEDGITYERASIEDWFQKSKAKIFDAQENLKQNVHSEADKRIVDTGICSPVYGSKMKSLILTPNTGIRNMARAFEDKKGAARG